LRENCAGASGSVQDLRRAARYSHRLHSIEARTDALVARAVLSMQHVGTDKPSSLTFDPSEAGVAIIDPTEVAIAQTVDVVVTPMKVAASRSQVWDRLMFYEQVDQRPPLHLRLLLPVPIRTIGDKSHIGDEARCLYEGGHLIKRITAVNPGRVYAFEVIEQALRVGGSMKLVGGEYRLDEGPSGVTVMTLSTRYTSSRRPRWLWRPIEAAVCHSFHRHILRAIRRNVEAR
jgi:hypothetical protein